MKCSFSLLAAAICASSVASVILPMGDSITVGQYGSGFTPGAWRSRLELLDASISFVGPTVTNPAQGQVSINHCAFSGTTSDWVQPRAGFWGASLAIADAVTFEYGVNDLTGGASAAACLLSIDTSLRTCARSLRAFDLDELGCTP